MFLLVQLRAIRGRKDLGPRLVVKTPRTARKGGKSRWPGPVKPALRAGMKKAGELPTEISLTMLPKTVCAQCALLEPFDSLSDWNLSFLKQQSGQQPAVFPGSHGKAATTITSTSIPGRQKSVVRQARTGGFAGSTHSFQTEL
jgi:hypothetical protein